MRILLGNFESVEVVIHFIGMKGMKAKCV